MTNLERLIVIVDCGGAESVGALLDRVARGSVLVQLRDKGAPEARLRAAAAALRAVTREAGARLVVNGRVDVAAEVGADGVHLPEAAGPVGEARAALAAAGRPLIVGVSRHSIGGAVSASEEGADYVVLGPVWETPGKGAPIGLEVIRAAAAALKERFLPPEDRPRARLFAVGGIDTPERAADCLRADADGVAVIRAAAQAAELLAAMERA